MHSFYLQYTALARALVYRYRWNDQKRLSSFRFSSSASKRAHYLVPVIITAMASSTVSAFTTDWDNIGRFVLETASQGTIPNTTREYLKQRLVSSEDHIVLITLSVRHVIW